MKKKPFRKFKTSENSLEGEFILEGPRVRLLFRFDPTRVAFVKGIKGARYDPDSKTWSIPRDKFTEINTSKLFPEDRFPRRFSDEDLLQKVEELQTLKQEALESYQKNPFSLESKYIDILGLEVVFYLSSSSPQLRARVRFGSKATSILVRMKGAHFIRSEALFAVPTAKLPDLLLKLRDKKISFAVEASCSERLRSSAELRKRLLLDPEKNSPSELEEALLSPYVDFSEDSQDVSFVVKHATSRHLAELFPDHENFHVRKKLSLNLTEQELLILLNRVSGLKYPLYFARAVFSHLSRKGVQYDEAINAGELALSEALLPFLKKPKVWAVLSNGEAGLLIDQSLERPKLLQSLNSETVGGKHFFLIKQAELLQFYQELSKVFFAEETESFGKLIKELALRASELKRNNDARMSSDAILEESLFSDPQLVGRLFPHQRVAVKWLSAREYSMLGDDMGLGKTLSVIACLDLLLKSGEVSFSLIVCPASLTRNWVREAHRFVPSRNFLILPEAQTERRRLLSSISRGERPCDALVVNYERLRRPDVKSGLIAILEKRNTLLCCDESQRAKNARSQTFLAVNELASLCARRIALTGTPTPRDVTDIWSQVYLLDRGKRFGHNYTKWLKEVAELGTQYSDFAVRKFKPDAVAKTVSRVHELLLRRRKEEVLSLPEKTFTTRDCKLNGSQEKRYKEVCEQLLLRITTISGESFIKQIDNLLEEYLRAVQIASNPRLVDETWQGDPGKYLELDEIVQEVVREKGEKLVIWTNFLGNVAELIQRYADLGARPFSGEVSTSTRDSTVQEFQNGSEIKILVAIPAAGGVGITLTAAQTAVYLDKSWNAEHWLQSVDRIHRIGQKGSVSIISLSACKIDELISKNLARKSKMQAALLGDDTEPQTLEINDYPSKEELLAALKD